jgi:hypothetical protein
MRHTRQLALAVSITLGVTGVAGTAFSLTADEGTDAASKSGRTSKQALALLDRYEADQAAAEKAEVEAFLRTLEERERYLAGVAAAEQARQEAARAAAERQRASRAATATRTATRAPAYGPWADLINQYPWPTDTASRVMMCESRGDANAYNPRSGATGLFQILNGPFDPAQNVALAFQMWQSRGWQPWRACI